MRKDIVLYIVVIFMKKYASGKFYDSHNDKMEHSEAKLFIEDALNDDFKKTMSNVIV